jgi:hypothetical protein
MESIMRSKAELIEIYGVEGVRERSPGRLQVMEEHAGRKMVWVDEEDALPPVEPSDPVVVSEADLDLGFEDEDGEDEE